MNTPKDTASILYPDEAPASNPPDYFVAQFNAATSRLAGRGPRQADDAEAVLYPDDQPKDAAPSQRPAARAKPEAKGDDEPATLTYADAAKFDATEATSFFDQSALAAMQDGDRERAAELGQAGKALVADMKAAGTDHAVFNEALRAFNEADGEALSEDQRAERAEATMAQLQAELGPRFDADLAAAQALIRDLDMVAPGLIHSLNASGAGNHPKIIKAAIAEAKRRGYGRR